MFGSMITSGFKAVLPTAERHPRHVETTEQEDDADHDFMFDVSAEDDTMHVLFNRSEALDLLTQVLVCLSSLCSCSGDCASRVGHTG